MASGGSGSNRLSQSYSSSRPEHPQRGYSNGSAGPNGVLPSSSSSPSMLAQPPPRQEGKHSLTRVTDLFASRKFYCEGWVYKCVDLINPTDSAATFDKFYLQLMGNELSIYLKITDAFTTFVDLRSRPPEQQPPPTHPFVFALCNAGGNRILFACETQQLLAHWVNNLRLAEWEISRLSEIFTGTLIGTNEGDAAYARSPLVKGRMEGLVEFRPPGDTDWFRAHLVVTDESARDVKQKRRSSLIGAFSSLTGSSSSQSLATDAGPGTGMSSVAFFASRKARRPFLVVSNVYYAAAVYPEHVKLIETSTIFKLEGSVVWDPSADVPKGLILGGKPRDGGRAGDQAGMLVMPTESGANSQRHMLAWVVAIADAFRLYGRGRPRPDGALSFDWDPRSPSSPYFAYPIGQHRERLFFDPQLCEHLDIWERSPQVIRSKFCDMLVDRMRRGPAIAPPPPVGQQQQQQPGRNSPRVQQAPIARSSLPPIGESAKSRNGSIDEPSPVKTAAPVVALAPPIVEEPAVASASAMAPSSSQQGQRGYATPIVAPTPKPAVETPYAGLSASPAPSSTPSTRAAVVGGAAIAGGSAAAAAMATSHARQEREQQSVPPPVARATSTDVPPTKILPPTPTTAPVRPSEPATTVVGSRAPIQPRSPTTADPVIFDQSETANWLSALDYADTSGASARPEPATTTARPGSAFGGKSATSGRRSIESSSHVAPPLPVASSSRAIEPDDDVSEGSPDEYEPEPTPIVAAAKPTTTEPVPSSYAPSRQALERELAQRAAETAKADARHRPGRSVGAAAATTSKVGTYSSDEEDDEPDELDSDDERAQAAAQAPPPPQESPQHSPIDRRASRRLPEPPRSSQFLANGISTDDYAGANRRQSYIDPSETGPQVPAFAPGGLLHAGLQQQQERSARVKEADARAGGGPLIDLPTKAPTAQTGLVGAISAHERDRKREGGLGATLTERHRDREEAERQQMQPSPMQQHPMSMYGAPYGMPPMMSPYGQYGDPAMMQAAMQAAQHAFMMSMMQMQSHMYAQQQQQQQQDGRSPSPSGPASPPMMGMPMMSPYGFGMPGMFPQQPGGSVYGQHSPQPSMSGHAHTPSQQYLPTFAPSGLGAYGQQQPPPSSSRRDHSPAPRD